MREDTITPTQLAVQIWGKAENHSRSAGARNVRRAARRLFPDQWPGKGGQWELTPDMAAAIRREVA
jgi:hypothetical protein